MIELCFIIGFKSRTIKLATSQSPKLPTYNILTSNFGLILGIITLLIQLYGLKTTGLIVLNEEVNHLSVYDGLGPLKAFLFSLRTLFFIYFFYKRKIHSLSFFDWSVFIVVIFGIITSGSKSGIMTPVTLYFIVEYYFKRKFGVPFKRIKKSVLVCILLFPIVVILLHDRGNIIQSLMILFARFAANGDIYVLGFNDTVIKNISDTSFLKYIFYPGWGTILKTIGFDITPPEGLGVNIYRQYYNIYDSGPNTRLNYLLYYFFNTPLGCLFSFCAGKIVRFVRENYAKNKSNFFLFFVSTIMYCNILSIISDINIFLNNTFWALFSFFFIYFVSQLVSKVNLELKRA